MKKSSSKLFLAALALVALAGFTMAPVAEAARGGGGGGGGGGNARRRWRRSTRRAAAVPIAQRGGERKNVQANNAQADKRTNNVRNTSVNNVNVNNNNVNVNKNVNVNVEGRRLLQQRLGQRLSPDCDGRGRHRDRGRDLGRHRLDGEHRAAQLRAGELRRHGLPAVRQHLVPGARAPVHRRQSAVLTVGRCKRAAGCPGGRPARGKCTSTALAEAKELAILEPIATCRCSLPRWTATSRSTSTPTGDSRASSTAHGSRP